MSQRRFDAVPRGAERHSLGGAMASFVREAYPLCRSITGDSVRQTFDCLERFLGTATVLERTEVATGTKVLDWEVPREWNLERATLKNPQGEIIVDSFDSNLHVLNYSVPVHQRMSLQQLEPHLYSLPEQPTLIPYRTSYYQERWGFCLSHEQRLSLQDGLYEVTIESTLDHGALTYAEIVVPGASDEEVLVSAHSCHPSLCNDNLSGMIVAGALARRLTETANQARRHYTYRIVFAPGTLGAITWLAKNEAQTDRIQHGLIASNLGYSHKRPTFHYKRSRRGDAAIDRAVSRVLANSQTSYEIEDFTPFGYDERQYCSPGFNLPVGLLSRTPWGQYPQYHTSADDLSLLNEDVLLESLDLYLNIMAELESSQTTNQDADKPAGDIQVLRTSPSQDGTAVFLNQFPKGEPQLGRRGLYSTLGGGDEGRNRQLALLWVLNLSDGRHSLGDIQNRSALPTKVIEEAARLLQQAGLLAAQG